MGRTTKAENEIRVAKVVELLALGLTRGEIIRYTSEKTKWDVSTRTIEKYMQKATIEIIAAAKTDRAATIGRAKVRLDMLYKRNMKITDYKAALQVMKREAELLGLDEPTQKVVTADIDTTITVEIIPHEGHE